METVCIRKKQDTYRIRDLIIIIVIVVIFMTVSNKILPYYVNMSPTTIMDSGNGFWTQTKH